MLSVSTCSVYEDLDSSTEEASANCLLDTPLPQEDLVFCDLTKECPADSSGKRIEDLVAKLK